MRSRARHVVKPSSQLKLTRPRAIVVCESDFLSSLCFHSLADRMHGLITTESPFGSGVDSLVVVNTRERCSSGLLGY